MVRLSCVQFGVKRTFGLQSKGKIFNHRVPIKYQRFQDNLDPQEILAHYSREDIDQIDPREGIRTYKDAQNSLSKKNFLLPNLSSHDLESNEIFQKELERQRAIIARVNKINVIIDSVPGQGTELTLDKDLSTPYDCARHIHHLLTSRSVVAELSSLDAKPPSTQSTESFKNNSGLAQTDESKISESGSDSSSLVAKRPIFWDMHRPLKESCRIKFRHFQEEDVREVNKIYWRSCSFILGMAVRLAFKDDVKVLLHSWPKPNVKSGSFIYDLALNLSDKWRPDEQELRAFTKIMWSIKNAGMPFERLEVDREIARELFSKNTFKLTQIDSIIENSASEGKVTVYRCGGLLDVSIGPMISNTSQIGRITLAAVHPFETESPEFKGIFYRFQGVSLPQQLPLSSYLYQNVLINNAKKFNKASL